MDENERRDRWVLDWYQKADKNADGRLEFKEMCKLLQRMNVGAVEDHAYRLFATAAAADGSASGAAGLAVGEFVRLYGMLTQRTTGEEVWRNVFREYSGDGDALTLEELESFLGREQKVEEHTAAAYAQELIRRYEPSDDNGRRSAMSAGGFQAYLLSEDDGSVFEPRYRELHQDMSRPLSHYFISTSYNTYLTADQLAGPSSTEAYVRALRRGCRCVEVECWDGRDGQPTVYHGYTVTSKIPFRDVVATIGQHAFEASDFPVIVSIDNHCSVAQQDVMAQHLHEILGDLLLRSPLDGGGDEEVPEKLPSPQALRGKILVKSKKTGRPEEEPGPNDGPTADERSDDEEKDDETWGTCDSEDEDDAKSETRKTSSSTDTLSGRLSDLIIYCQGVGFQGFDDARQNSKCYQMSSFSEKKARKLVRSEGAHFVRHNATHLSRIYPEATRTDSSNFRPHQMWSGGCQLVALNFQTAGLEMDLNDGLFAQNGGSGYVLKPDFMRYHDADFDPERPEDFGDYCPLKLSVRVIGGQQLPVVNAPLVRVEVYGVPRDEDQQQTAAVQNNGFNAVWNETLDFVVRVPELALVRFVVEDNESTCVTSGNNNNNNFIGQFTLPFDCIRVGYRHVRLRSQDGTAIPAASLFVHVSISEYSEDTED